MNRKAQSAVPIMIVLIAVFAVLYVYLIPLSEKCKLMPDLQECVEKATEQDRINERNLAEIIPETLVEEEIGLLSSQQKYAVYSLRPIDIYNIKDVEIATILEKEEVEKDWFSNNEKKGAFSINERSQGVNLFLYLSRGEGNLKININSEIKFIVKEEDLEKDMPIEIYIPSENLEKMNIVRLSVSTPLTPFQKNEYEVEKIIIKETYRLTEDTVENSIGIKENLDNLEGAYLYYNPHCLTNEKLSVSLNDEEIKDEILCSEKLMDVTEKIREENSIIFSTKGNYFINPIKLHLKFERANNTIFYFDVEEKEYEQIKRGIALVFLRMDFDSTESKKIDLYINDELLSVETDEIDYETAINGYIKNGENIVELSSREDSKVNLLKIDMR